MWRKLCGLALGVALLPSLAGGGACLEHAVHALSGDMVTAVNSDVDAGHDGHSTGATNVRHSSGVAHEGHSTNVANAEQDHSGALAVHDHRLPHAHLAAVLSVADAPSHDCCPPASSPEHCAGAAGCSVSAIVIDSSDAARIIVATHIAPLAGVLAPPGPARAPDVPPPRA